MTTPGFPDYARLSQSGNKQLAFINGGNLTNGQQLFRGYVGSWPYLAMFINMGATVDFAKFIVNYYSDSTFGIIVGFRFSIRWGAQFSSVVYGNMSDWATVQVFTQSTNPIPIGQFGVYATQGYTPTLAVDSLDVPLLFEHFSVPAATTSEFNIQHVHPGKARFLVNSAATSWQVKFRYYDWGTNSIQTMYQTQTFGVPTSTSEDFPQLDAPCYVDFVNNDAAAKTFIGCLLVEA